MAKCWFVLVGLGQILGVFLAAMVDPFGSMTLVKLLETLAGS